MEISYELTFDDVIFPSAGYAFPCDKEGRILWDSVPRPDVLKRSLAYCKNHPERWTADSRHGKVVQVVRRVRYAWDDEPWAIESYWEEEDPLEDEECY